MWFSSSNYDDLDDPNEIEPSDKSGLVVLPNNVHAYVQGVLVCCELLLSAYIAGQGNSDDTDSLESRSITSLSSSKLS